ncbi:MAG: LysE family transporter [Patescibacteria group bacterium]
MTFLSGLLIISGLTYTTAILPGPDMVIVLKNSLLRSKKDGLMTALGSILGNCVYVALALAGLGIIITQSVLLFSILKYLGAGYIIFLGIKLLQAKPVINLVTDERVTKRSAWQALREGFLTNMGNPKFLLFLFGIFTQVITPDTPFLEQIAYGVEIPIFAFLAFATVALIAGAPIVRRILTKSMHYVEHVIGVALIALGLKVLLDSAH